LSSGENWDGEADVDTGVRRPCDKASDLLASIGAVALQLLFRVAKVFGVDK
jgi:hypothetical protein